MENNLIFIKVRRRIEEDVVKIEEMINACVSVKGQRKCPLYQDVIDTQRNKFSSRDRLYFSRSRTFNPSRFRR